jgi:AcrR family transcriptional regulator
MSAERSKHPAKLREILRREPTQARAMRTKETIFEATAQIVFDEGPQALNTNRIAERAGFSVGTLYQYFPSKEAILLAMIERKRNRVLDRLSVLMDGAIAQDDSTERFIRQLVHILIEEFGTGGVVGPELTQRSAMVRLAWQMDGEEDVAAALQRGADRLAVFLQEASTRNPKVGLRVSADAVYVAVRAIMGVIRSASIERSPRLTTMAFEDELVRLAHALLTDVPQ